MAWHPPLHTNQIRNRWSKAVRAKSIEIFARILDRTPVLTGNAQANWHITMDVPSDSYWPKLTQVDYASQFGALNVLHNVKQFKMIFIQNNTPYIGDLEYGSSLKSPEGMVRVTVAEMS
jgi:hypothetical protein